MSKDDQKELMVALSQLSANIDHLGRLGASNTNSSITVSAGGIGVWICACACMMMLSMAMVGGFWISREFTRIDQALEESARSDATTQSYLNAIYVHAPHLKPKDQDNE